MTTYNDYAQTRINAALQAAAARKDRPAKFAPEVHRVRVVAEDYTGELINYFTVDVQYHPDGYRALYGFEPGSDQPALWMD